MPLLGEVIWVAMTELTTCPVSGEWGPWGHWGASWPVVTLSLQLHGCVWFPGLLLSPSDGAAHSQPRGYWHSWSDTMHHWEGQRRWCLPPGQWDAHVAVRWSGRQPSLHPGRVRSVDLSSDWHWQDKIGGERQSHVQVWRLLIWVSHFWNIFVDEWLTWWQLFRREDQEHWSWQLWDRETSWRLYSRWAGNTFTKRTFLSTYYYFSISYVKTDPQPVIATSPMWISFVICTRRSELCWTKWVISQVLWSKFLEPVHFYIVDDCTYWEWVERVII